MGRSTSPTVGEYIERSEYAVYCNEVEVGEGRIPRCVKRGKSGPKGGGGTYLRHLWSKGEVLQPLPK